MKQKTYLQVTGVLFGIIAVLHGLRLLNGWDVSLGDWAIPIWGSVVGLIVAAYLSYSAFKLGK